MLYEGNHRCPRVQQTMREHAWEYRWINAAIQHAIEVPFFQPSSSSITAVPVCMHPPRTVVPLGVAGVHSSRPWRVGRLSGAGFLYLYIRCVVVYFHRAYALTSTLWMAATREGNRTTTSSSPDFNTIHTSPILRHRYTQYPDTMLEFWTVGISDGILHNRTCI
jgi:hypothetical protein